MDPKLNGLKQQQCDFLMILLGVFFFPGQWISAGSDFAFWGAHGCVKIVLIFITVVVEATSI